MNPWSTQPKPLSGPLDAEQVTKPTWSTSTWTSPTRARPSRCHFMSQCLLFFVVYCLLLVIRCCVCVFLMQIQNQNKKKNIATLLMFVACNSCLYLMSIDGYMLIVSVQSQCCSNATQLRCRYQHFWAVYTFTIICFSIDLHHCANFRQQFNEIGTLTLLLWLVFVQLCFLHWVLHRWLLCSVVKQCSESQAKTCMQH